MRTAARWIRRPAGRDIGRLGHGILHAGEAQDEAVNAGQGQDAGNKTFLSLVCNQTVNRVQASQLVAHANGRHPLSLISP